jgi:hypothetical protein
MTDINSLPDDTSNAPAQSAGTTIKPGKYRMKVVPGEVDLGFTAEKKPQVAVLMEFVDGENAGQALNWYGYFTDATKQSTMRALRTLGWQGNDISDLSTVTGEADCTVVVEPGYNGGSPRAKIRYIGGGGVALRDVMTEDQKRAFAASMAGLAASIAPINTPGKKSLFGE